MTEGSSRLSSMGLSKFTWNTKRNTYSKVTCFFFSCTICSTVFLV